MSSDEHPLNQRPGRVSGPYASKERRRDVVAIATKPEPPADITTTLQEILQSHAELKRLVLAPRAPSGGDDPADVLEKKLSRAQGVGTILTWVASAVGLLFSAGVAWAVFLGANATDAEVDDAVHDAFIEHNAGIDPESINPTTGRPHGHHPDLRQAVESNSEAIKRIDEKVLPEIIDSQQKLDKRSRYQFELGRWQSEVTEAERKNEPPPRKPKELKDIEREIMLGNFSEG